MPGMLNVAQPRGIFDMRREKEYIRLKPVPSKWLGVGPGRRGRSSWWASLQHLWRKIMNLKIRPLLIAAGASLVMQVVVVIYINGIILPKTMLTVTSAIIITILDQFLVHVLAGGLYSFLSTREGPFSVRAGAVGGAIAGALGRLVGSPVNFLMASGLFHSLTTGEEIRPLEELYPGLTIELAIISGMCSIIITILIASVPGAIGGAIVAAITKSKTAPSS
jgi:hypothetical protein